eukprot:4778112-Prymnesium_polylepis.1
MPTSRGGGRPPSPNPPPLRQSHPQPGTKQLGGAPPMSHSAPVMTSSRLTLTVRNTRHTSARQTSSPAWPGEASLPPGAAG